MSEPRSRLRCCIMCGVEFSPTRQERCCTDACREVCRLEKCRRKQRRRYAANPAKVLARNRRWKEANRERAREWSRRYYRTHKQSTHKPSAMDCTADCNSSLPLQRPKAREWVLNCDCCGQQFTAARRGRKYCSDVCRHTNDRQRRAGRREHERRLQREWRIANREHAFEHKRQYRLANGERFKAWDQRRHVVHQAALVTLDSLGIDRRALNTARSDRDTCCIVCGRKFTRAAAMRTICSDECRRARMRQQQRDYRASRDARSAACCIVCGGSKPTRAAKLCSDDCRRERARQYRDAKRERAREWQRQHYIIRQAAVRALRDLGIDPHELLSIQQAGVNRHEWNPNAY
jgi:hypothetical protein